MITYPPLRVSPATFAALWLLLAAAGVLVITPDARTAVMDARPVARTVAAW